MRLERAVHQKSAKAERGGASKRSEGEPGASRDEVRAAHDGTQSLGRDDLLAQALARANLVMAWKRVKANRGSAGVDGKSIAETAEDLKTHWPGIREALLDGSYRPQPVRRVQIPKLGGRDARTGDFEGDGPTDPAKPCCKSCSPSLIQVSLNTVTASGQGVVRVTRC